MGCGGLDSAAYGPVTSDAKVAPDAAVCEQLAVAARARVDAYLQSTSSHACQVDSDCSLLWLGSCLAGCGLPVATSAASSVTAASTGVCDQYSAAGCVPTVLLCPALRAVCDYGTCASGRPTGLSFDAADAAVDAGTGAVPIDGGAG